MVSGKEADTEANSFVSILEKFPQQLREASQLGKDISVSVFDKIVICGMGGSGLPAELTRSFVTDLPVISVKDYTLPLYVDENSLLFIVSYSGTTEEMLDVYAQAKKRKLKPIIIASGGDLAAHAQADSMQFVQVPTGYPPRMAWHFQTIPILNILENVRMIKKIDWNSVAIFLENEAEKIRKESEQLAQKIGKKIPCIYACAHMAAVAYKWKKNFNENAKIHAFSNTFPEWNHNEVNAYEKNADKVSAIMFHDANDLPRNAKRMQITAEIIGKNGGTATIVECHGPTRAHRIARTIWLGDWTSYFTAHAWGVDPKEIKIIQALKESLQR